MPLGGKAKTAAEATLRQYEELAPGVAAVAKETVGGLLVTEGWTGIPTLSRQNTPASIASGAFLCVFGAVWLAISSFVLLGVASRGSAPVLFVLVFLAVGVATLLSGCWQVATGVAVAAAGSSLRQEGRVAQAGNPPLSETDRAAVVQSVSSTYRHLRNPNLATVEAEIAMLPQLAQFRAGVAHLPQEVQNFIGIDLAPPPAEPAAILQPEVDPYAPGAATGTPTQWPSMPLSSRLPDPTVPAWSVPPPSPAPVAEPAPWPSAPAPVASAGPAPWPSAPAPVPTSGPESWPGMPAPAAAPTLEWPAATPSGPQEWRPLGEASALGDAPPNGAPTAPEAP